MTVSTGVIQAPQALKAPAMQEFIVVVTPYNTGENRTTWRLFRKGNNGSNPGSSGSGTSAVYSCPSPTPPSVCTCNGSVVNIGQTTTPKFRNTSELYAFIDKRLYNNSNVPSIVSQILRDELPVSSGRDIYSRCSMNVSADTAQPVGPQLVRHGLLTIDTLNENTLIYIHVTSEIRKTPNTIRGSASEHVV